MIMRDKLEVPQSTWLQYFSIRDLAQTVWRVLVTWFPKQSNLPFEPHDALAEILLALFIQCCNTEGRKHKTESENCSDPSVFEGSAALTAEPLWNEIFAANGSWAIQGFICPGPRIDRSYHLWCGMTQLIFADAHSRRYPLYVCTVRNHLFLRISRLVFSPCPLKEVVKETTIFRQIAHGMFNALFALDVPPTLRYELPLPGLFEISFKFPSFLPEYRFCA